MKFEKYEVRILNKQDTLSFFQLIENNRTRLEDFFAGVVSKTNTLADNETFIDEIVEKNANRTYFPYVIINTGNQELIGFIDVKNIDWIIPKGELGYFIDEEYTGKGIAKNALNLVVDYFFSELRFVKLFLRTHEQNEHGRRLAEKCGFVVEGIIRKDYKTTKGVIVDLMYYGKINNGLND